MACAGVSAAHLKGSYTSGVCLRALTLVACAGVSAAHLCGANGELRLRAQPRASSKTCRRPRTQVPKASYTTSLRPLTLLA